MVEKIQLEDEFIREVVVDHDKGPRVLIGLYSGHQIEVTLDCDGVEFNHLIPNDDWSEDNFLEEPHIRTDVASLSYETIGFELKDE